LPGCVTRQG